MVENYKEILYDNETLDCARITLRKFRKSDAQAVFDYGSDEETLRYLIWEGVKTLEEAKKSIFEHYWSRPGIFAIALKETDACIGAIDLRMEPEHEKAGFGYVLNRAHWGKGYMTEALSALLALCFESLELNRVESYYFVGNEGSARVMQKCGMEAEGTAKQALKIKGVFRDEARCGITRARWLELASKHFQCRVPNCRSFDEFNEGKGQKVKRKP